MDILVTGGTVFVSRYIAKYFKDLGNTVYVLNRGNHEIPDGVIHIKGDRGSLGDILKSHSFDVVIDDGYTLDDVKNLHEALGGFKTYIFISSSAVYKDTNVLPFKESDEIGYNSYWKDYGLNKIAAEEYINKNIKNSYIIRPPYLYGPMNNIYREAFIFECIENNLPIYIPKNGKMPLQFFLILDLAKFILEIIRNNPKNRIYNVGNKEIVDINTWVKECFYVLGKSPKMIYVNEDINQRDYFPFLDYSYILDTNKQDELLKDLTPLSIGLRESYLWYSKNKDKIRRKPLIDFINQHFRGILK